MKKLFSILCAFAIVLSASAAPVNKQVRQEKANRAFVENVKHEKKATPAKAAKKTLRFNKVGKSITLGNAKSVNKVAPARKHAFKANKQVARAQKAKKEAVELLFNSENADIEWDDMCAEEGWWQIQAESEEAYVSISNLDREEAAGEYAWEDLDPDYCVLWTPEMGEDLLYFTDGSCTVTVDETDGLKVSVVGSFSDEEGNTYDITIVYEEAPLEPGEWDIVIGKVTEKFYAADNDVYVVMVDEDNTCKLTFDMIIAEGETELELGKTYTIDEMLASYTTVVFQGVSDYLVEAEVTKTVDEEGLAHFVGSAKDSYDRVFNFAYDEKPFVPTGEVVEHDFALCASLSYSEYFEDWTIRASDDEFAFQLDILSDNADSPLGDFSSENKDFDLDYTYVNILDEDGEAVRVYAHDAAAVILESNDTIKIVASIIGVDGVEYHFNAFFAAPTKQGEVTIEATNLVIDDSWFSNFGIVWADASNDDYEVSLAFYPDSSIFDIFEFGDQTTGTVNGINIYSGNFTIAKDAEGNTNLTGKALCFDNIEYTLDLTFLKPEKTREEVLDIAEATFTIYPEDGYWRVIGLNVDSSRYISLLAFFDESVAGTYTTDDFEAKNIFVANTVVNEDEELVAEEIFDLLDAEVTITLSEDGSIANIAGKFLGQGEEDPTDVPEFSFDFNTEVEIYKEEPEGNEYDAEEDFVVDFAEWEIDDQYLENYGVLFIYGDNKENREYISLELWLPEGAEGLVAGEYPVVADEFVAQSVTAGTLENNYIYGSFAGTLTEDGYINVPLWFFADGKVTVTEGGSIIVDALNTKGAKIQCRLKATFTITDTTNTEYGYIVGNLSGKEMDSVVLEAIPYVGYEFVQWSDGVTENPRTIVLTQDTVLAAEFQMALSGVCGKDNALSWTYDVDNAHLNITGEGELTENYSYWVAAKLMRTLTLGDSITIIGENAFAYNENLENLTLPANLVEIGAFAFWNCFSLASLILPESLKVLGTAAFAQCYLITEVTIPEGVEFIGSGANFQRCTSLQSVVWNARNAEIVEYTDGNVYAAFILSDSVSSFTFGPNVEVIPQALCALLPIEQVVIPESVVTIEADAFYGCENLSSITVPSNVTTIEDYAFSNCYTLDSIRILNADAQIDEAVLYGCESLRYIEAPASVLYNELWTSQLTEVVINGGEMYDYCFTQLQYSALTLRSLDLKGAYVEGLREGQFSVYRRLEELKLPASLTKIDYASVASAYYITEITIPASVTAIEDRAFEDCRSLTQITFEGAQVAKIGNWAFYNCHELEEIDLPEGVEEIGLAAFYGCAYAQTIHLPASVRSIGDNGFALCTKMSRMDVDAVLPPDVKDKTFYEVSTEAPVYVPDESVEDYKAHPVWGKLNIIGKSYAPSGIDDVETSTNASKLIRDGQVLIHRGDKTYTVIGQETK